MAKRTRKPCSSIEFFKIFLSRFSSRQLCFPPAFVAQLDGAAPKEVTLKDHTEKVWNVQLEKTETQLIIKKGWQEFASHHSLVDGDFLVFRYDGTSHFLVKVYDRNGLKKEKVLADKEYEIHVKEETETEEGENRNLSIRVSKRKYFEMAHKQTQKSVGWSGRSPLKLKWTGENQSQLRKTRGRKPGYLQLTETQLYAPPKNPHFVTIMSKSTRYDLYVHKKVLKEHNIELQEDMKLRDENGKLWPVKIYCKDSRRIKIHEGWREFYTHQNMALRDICIFEFIPTEDNIIQVQIVRRKSKIIPEPVVE